MAFGSSTIADIGAGVGSIFQSQATAKSLKLKAAGDIVEGQNYALAAALAKQNEQFTEQSYAVKQALTNRAIQQGVGEEQAAIAGAGFAESGTGLDLLRSSAQQGALNKQVLAQQGLITEAGYNEQQQAYSNLANFAKFSAAYQQKEASSALRTGWITAGIDLAAGVASAVTGLPSLPTGQAANPSSEAYGSNPFTPYGTRNPAYGGGD